MQGRPPTIILAALGMCALAAHAAHGAMVIVGIDSVTMDADKDVTSITVGSDTFLAADLVTGTTTASPIPTGLANVDDFNLLSLSHQADYHETRMFGGSELYSSTNGSKPDFFYFELGGNDAIKLQAVLSDDTLGQLVEEPSSVWNGIGLFHPNYGNQQICGIAFDITALKDGSGNPLGAGAQVKGLHIVGTGNDPVTLLAYVPEPSATVLLALGAMGALLRRRRA